MSERTGPAEGVDESARALISRCLDGVATEAEAASLDALIVKSAAVARALARTAMLESTLEVVSRERSEELAAPRRARPVPSRRWPAVLLVAAALAISSISAAFILGRARRPSTRESASLPGTRPSPSAWVAPSAPGALPTQPATAVDIAPTPAVSESASVEAGRKAAPARSGEDALRAANKLRREGRWAEAAHAYTQIANEYSGTARGSVAALSAASLRLEHLNDPRGALRLYRVALGASDLSAEAELGIADCYRALGDRDGEIAALERLVGEHPDALSRERASRRLDALRSQRP